MREMRDSGVEWLGEIPAPWTVSKFRHTFRESKESNGTAPVGEMLSVSGYLGVVPKVYQEESLKRDADQLETYRVVRKGQLAINTMWLNYGGLGVSELEGHMSPAYRAYWISADINPRFAHHLLRSQLYISGYTAFLTGVRPNSLQMSRENLMNFPVILPPLEEQKAIVKFLENETREIDTLISKKEQLIEKLLERRQALITQVVTKGLDPNVPMKESGVEWLGEVPASWQVKKLGRVASFHNGRELERSDSGHYRVYGSGGIFSWSDEAQNSSEKPSVLFGRKGTVDKPILATGPFSCVDTMYWTSFTPGVDARFIYYLATAFPYKEISTATALPSMTSSALKSVSICLPDHKGQLRVADHLDKETTQIDTLVEKTRKAIELLKERRQALITQVVTGKIDVRGFAGGNS